MGEGIDGDKVRGESQGGREGVREDRDERGDEVGKGIHGGKVRAESEGEV